MKTLAFVQRRNKAGGTGNWLAMNDLVESAPSAKLDPASKLRGRAFAPSDDTERPRVVVINQTMADTFYRGEDPVLSDLSCFQSGIVGTMIDDDGDLGTRGLLLYLTSAFACAQESTLGEDSDGTNRPNAAPCP